MSERSSTELPLQPLPLQSKDQTQHSQMAMAKHKAASFSMDLPLHLRLPRAHSMAWAQGTLLPINSSFSSPLKPQQL
uniref:Uncharacterized protein n=1 Tax=Arundo donax TaxID=35708 RepID=A0A0A9EUB6_ARUDO